MRFLRSIIGALAWPVLVLAGWLAQPKDRNKDGLR